MFTYPPPPAVKPHLLLNRAEHITQTFDPCSSSADAAAAAEVQEQQWQYLLEHRPEMALVQALQQNLRGDSEDAVTALELLNGALQEVRQKCLSIILLLLFSLWVGEKGIKHGMCVQFVNGWCLVLRAISSSILQGARCSRTCGAILKMLKRPWSC
jgi:hypothetical protein